jgi:catechol 2,3-dioxygenase-like lactoylglutathione lyase family enzyme
MLEKSKLIAFVATADAAGALRFYRDVLGLTLLSDEPFALVFDANGTKLHIQKVAAVQPAPYTAIGWEVLDIAASVTALSKRGVHFERFPHFEQDETGVWTAPGGARVAWFKDPSGQLLSLTQL